MVKVAGRELAGAVERVGLMGIFLPLLPPVRDWSETYRTWDARRPRAGLAADLAAPKASRENILS
jgi:hypothetical protein